MRNLTYGQEPTRTIRGALRGWVSRRGLTRRGRGFAVLLLAPILAVGVVTLTPVAAYAAIPEAKTPLAQGKVAYAQAGAVFGSTVVWDTQRSANGGSTWVSDPALAASPSWNFVGGGVMVSLSQPVTTSVTVYTPGSGAVAYAIPSSPYAVNGTYASYGTTVRTLSRRCHRAPHRADGRWDALLADPDGGERDPLARHRGRQRVRPLRRCSQPDDSSWCVGEDPRVRGLHGDRHRVPLRGVARPPA